MINKIISFFKKSKKVDRQIDDMFQICMDRDRTQSFDDWVSLAIQNMAIDEIEKENTDQALVYKLKQRWGDDWEIMYPTARVKQELSENESYWTLLRKFDERVKKDLK